MKAKQILGICLVMASLASYAKSQEVSSSIGDKKVQVQMQKETDRWMGAVFGNCFSTVRKMPYLDYAANLEGTWTKLRKDALTTQNLQLFDAYESPEGRFIIIDKNKSGSSCWTQFSTVRPEIAFQAFDAIVNQTPTSKKFEMLEEKNIENGGTQFFYLYNPDDGYPPIIIYHARMAQPRLSSIVTIVQIADVSEKRMN